VETDGAAGAVPQASFCRPVHVRLDARFARNSTQRGSNPLAEIPRHSENRRHFSRLAARSPVSSEGHRTCRAKRREFGGESLLDEFSISEIQERRAARPVASWHPTAATSKRSSNH
jgi:hypothetical protein